jgi:hypothetical protein
MPFSGLIVIGRPVAKPGALRLDERSAFQNEPIPCNTRRPVNLFGNPMPTLCAPFFRTNPFASCWIEVTNVLAHRISEQTQAWRTASDTEAAQDPRPLLHQPFLTAASRGFTLKTARNFRTNPTAYYSFSIRIP